MLASIPSARIAAWLSRARPYRCKINTGVSGAAALISASVGIRRSAKFNVEANIGRPQVAYRETIRRPAEKVEGKFVRQTGGRGQYGHVVIKVQPQEPGGGYEFVNSIVGGVIPKEYIPAIDKGIKDALLNGVMAGFPMVDVKVELVHGSYHDVDSSEQAFYIAGSMAVKEACPRCRCGRAWAPAVCDDGRSSWPLGLICKCLI